MGVADKSEEKNRNWRKFYHSINGVADKSEAKKNRFWRKLKQYINGGSRQKWGKKTEIDAN